MNTPLFLLRMRKMTSTKCPKRRLRWPTPIVDQKLTVSFRMHAYVGTDLPSAWICSFRVSMFYPWIH